MHTDLVGNEEELMKRYEKMSKEEIIDAFGYLFGDCDKCQYHKICNGRGYCPESAVIKEWLTQEIETVPRIKTLDTKKKFIKAQEEYKTYCHSIDCSDCRYHKEVSIECFTEFLWEEVEV
jgi:radical SAM protein with 4Fe4S-binding SPASM domain